MAIFDRDASCMCDRNCPEARGIRRLMKIMKDRRDLQLENGVYTMTVRVDVEDSSKPNGPSGSADQGFTRPVKP